MMSASERPGKRAANSAEVGRMSTAQFGDYVAHEISVWGEIIRAAGIKID